jgi:hypothetical protein
LRAGLRGGEHRVRVARRGVTPRRGRAREG